MRCCCVVFNLLCGALLGWRCCVVCGVVRFVLLLCCVTLCVCFVVFVLQRVVVYCCGVCRLVLVCVCCGCRGEDGCCYVLCCVACAVRRVAVCCCGLVVMCCVPVCVALCVGVDCGCWVSVLMFVKSCLVCVCYCVWCCG